jgi:cytochrome c551/c552
MHLFSLLYFVPLIAAWFVCQSTLVQSAQVSQITQNHPPKVTIVFPEKNTVVKPGQMIPYLVKVVDLEDGNSQFGEIEPTKVVMKIRYLNAMPPRSLQESPFDAGLVLISDKDCFTCHQWNTALVGPPIIEIAKKYDNSHTKQLVSSILQGSTENWGSEVMPAQVNVTEVEAFEIVQWIMVNGINTHQMVYAGLNASFLADQANDAGFYLLTAIYTDQGILGDPNTRLTDQDQVQLFIKK